MKITVDIDEVLLAEVKHITRSKDESAAINAALGKVATSEAAKRYFSEDPPPLTVEELRNAIPDDYDPKSIWYVAKPVDLLAPHESPAPSR